MHQAGDGGVMMSPEHPVQPGVAAGAHLLVPDRFAKIEHLIGHFWRVQQRQGTERELPGERGPRVTAVDHARHGQLGVLLDGDKEISRVQYPVVY